MIRKHIPSTPSQPDREIRSFLEKIVVNAGVGRASQQPNFEDKILPQITKDIAIITGQKPQVRRAKKSIAGFKVRQGQIVGLRATIRGRRMVDFFRRLITIVLPRIRDFKGIDSKSIDRGGALSVGFREQYVFPEISAEESPFTFSLEVTLVPRRTKREAALEAYKKFGVPLKN
jgi:large subunit ribosomal protein L5